MIDFVSGAIADLSNLAGFFGVLEWEGVILGKCLEPLLGRTAHCWPNNKFYVF